MAAKRDTYKDSPYCPRNIGFIITQIERKSISLKALDIPYNGGILHRPALRAIARLWGKYCLPEVGVIACKRVQFSSTQHLQSKSRY